MPVLNLNSRELKSRRFQLFVRALDGREDVALGALTYLWMRCLEDKRGGFSPSERLKYIPGPFGRVDALVLALETAGYVKLKMGSYDVVDMQPWIERAHIRLERAKKAGEKSVKVRAKKKARAKATAKEAALAPVRAEVVETQKQVLEMADDGLLAARACWEAYSAAYSRQFGVMPIRNVKINSLIKQFIKRIPQWDAPHVLKFYVGHGNVYYAQRMYPLDMAVKDAESLHTQWVTNRQVTRATMERFERNEKARVALEEGITF